MRHYLPGSAFSCRPNVGAFIAFFPLYLVYVASPALLFLFIFVVTRLNFSTAAISSRVSQRYIRSDGPVGMLF